MLTAGIDHPEDAPETFVSPDVPQSKQTGPRRVRFVSGALCGLSGVVVAQLGLGRLRVSVDSQCGFFVEIDENAVQSLG